MQENEMVKKKRSEFDFIERSATREIFTGAILLLPDT